MERGLALSFRAGALWAAKSVSSPPTPVKADMAGIDPEEFRKGGPFMPVPKDAPDRHTIAEILRDPALLRELAREAGALAVETGLRAFELFESGAWGLATAIEHERKRKGGA
jgi:hypothetical protein